MAILSAKRNRRNFLRESLRGLGISGLGFSGLGLSGLGIPVLAGSDMIAAEVGQATHQFKVEGIKRTTVRIPYRPAPRRAMERELPHWRYAEIFEIGLASGQTGIGETLLYYTWGVSGDDDVQRTLGKNAVDVMWDDSLGPGIQIALFDAVAKTIGVPVHRLLGRQVNTKTPLSWWNIDMDPNDMADECAEAKRLGYTSYKTKGRPWFDLWEQVEKASQKTPESFKIDMDFNDTLLDAKRALPILLELEKNPRIDIYESPIPQGDIEGNRQICEATRVGVAMHYGNPKPVEAIRQRVCDGFVIGGGARRVLHQANVAEMADMRFWLQLVGTGLTAAFSLHLGAVCRHATWPAVNCHQLYVHDMLAKPITLEAGFAQIPETPGLGYDLDRAAVEKYRTEKPSERPDPARLIEVSWRSGKRMYIANNGAVNFMLTLGQSGDIPFFERGVRTRMLPNDASHAWKSRYERAREKAFFE